VGHDELLAKLFGEISIPTGVFQELADPGAPLPVRQWIAKPPTWLRVHSLLSLPDPELMLNLDCGEREAIQLTIEKKADLLIIDEWKGRALAHRRGLPLVGALGILGVSYQRALTDQPLKILAEIRRQGFRISQPLVTKFEGLLHTKYAR
jgi:predicted nucleic acid-binding protein